MAKLDFEGVCLKFPGAERAALHNCTLRVAAGEFVVILGPSGCGKTTLLKTVNRLYELSAGTIYLNGTDIREFPVARLRRRIGYVIQKAGLFPHMSVAENIAVVPRLLGWPQARIRARTDALLQRVELPPQEYRNRYPAQLSGGQQQRVGIARALAADPQVLLMDEPFGALDAIVRASLQTEIARLQRQLQKTVLFVSHDVEEALRLADRILILQAGAIVQFDTPARILLEPATSFVAELVGATDRVRQLGVLPVAAAATAEAVSAEAPAIAQEASLREALSRLLETGAPALAVTRAGELMGSLTFANLREALLCQNYSTALDGHRRVDIDHRIEGREE